MIEVIYLRFLLDYELKATCKGDRVLRTYSSLVATFF